MSRLSAYVGDTRLRRRYEDRVTRLQKASTKELKLKHLPMLPGGGPLLLEVVFPMTSFQDVV